MDRIIPDGITLSQEGDVLTVDRVNDETMYRSLHGLTRTLVSNMVIGVTDGWSKELEIIGVGYRAAAAGPNALDLALGFSHPVKFTAPEGITFEVPVATRVIIKGADKEVVGQVAASIRKLRKPEPYKGKGVRYLGERVMRKAGKAAK
jgi:large subunit ribosomal protein L6